MRVGRPPLRSGHVEGLEGSSREKARLRAILDALSGEITVETACERLELSRSRFFELRARALQAALDGLVPGMPGRPPKPLDVEPAEIERLERDNEWLREELEIARVRTELALVMPHVLRDPKPPGGKSSARAGSSSRSGRRRSGTTRGSAS